MDKIAIKIDNLYFARESKLVFCGLNLAIARGKVTAIMGPSGTGKTTLLRLIGGQIFADSGTISVDGHTISGLSRAKLYALRRRMGVLFQEGALFSDFNVFQNVAFPLKAHTNLSATMLRDLVLLKLEAVGLRGAAHLQVSELSGGMARRVALARAIAMDPQLMMYDEPFTGQDPITRGVLVKLIRRVNDALGLTSVLVTHDWEQAKQLADQIVIIAEGKLLAEGAPEAIQAHGDPAVQQFINGLPDGAVPFQYPAKPIEEELCSES